MSSISRSIPFKVTLKTLLVALLIPLTIFQIPQAKAATVSDPSSICQLSVTSSTGVTINSTSVPVTLSDIYCLAAFKTVGTYSMTVPSTASTVDYLVVAGGGGGASGGGGAGGLRQGSNFSVTPNGSLTVTVGGGGAGGVGNGGAGVNGGNSSFGSITSIGGGAGNSGNRTVTSGGSGGGSSFDCTDNFSGPCGRAGAGTVGQGNNGGYSTYNSYGAGGGGGGAGGAGFNTTRNYIGGNGGIGATSALINALAAATNTGVLSSGNYYFAGGGGGGINSNDGQYVGLNDAGNLIYGGNVNAVANGTAYTNGGGKGGIGGGGRGSSFGAGAQGYTNPLPGTANTGGGGGGTDPEDINAAAGGSGIVIVRWIASTSLKTVTFDSNFGTSETSTQRVVSGVSTQLNAGTFARSGYIFSGWTTVSDGSGTSYADSNNITTSVDIILYAKWITGVNKTVTFNGNSSSSGSMSAQSAGTATALNANLFLRTNYTFTGWNTAANGTGYGYDDVAVYSFVTDTTLYAQWRANRTAYTVTFYANAVDASGTMSSQTADTPTALTLSGFTRAGYNFLGWHTSFNSGSASYLDGQTYAFSSNANLYAIWVAQAPNNVTFDGNGATSGTTASQTASSSTTLRANGFVRDGYTFLKWNTAANGSGTSYSSGYTYSFAAGLPLYAIWSRNLSISYSSNLATSGDTPTTQSYYVGGPTITVSNNAGNLARTGFTFSGWNTAADGTGRAYATGGSNSSFTNDTTLYAQWIGSTYYILYSGNGHTSGTAPTTDSLVYGGSGITISGNTGTLQKTGYTFVGWATEADGTGTQYAVGATNQTFAADTVLFAKWTGNTYTITYDANLGTGETTSASFLYGNTLTLNNPTRTGYSFTGWYDTTTAGSKIADGGAAYTAAQSRTLYGRWLINSYTYTYNGNGGSVDTSTVVYTYGDSDITLRTPTRASYQFEGWYTADTGGVRIGSAGQQHTPTATRTLFAQWTQLSLVGLDGATKIGTIVTSAGNGNTYSVSNSGTNVNIVYIADSLPNATVIDAYLLSNPARAAGLITDASNLLLSVVVAWKAADGSVPNTVSGSPITMTITNASIKAGAKIYSLVGNVVTLLGTASTDGSATAVFSEDPEIVIANPPVVTSGGGSSGGSVSTPRTEIPKDSTESKPTTEPAKPSQAPYIPTAPATSVPRGEALVTTTNLGGETVSLSTKVAIAPSAPSVLVIKIQSSQATLSTVGPNGSPVAPEEKTLILSKGDAVKFGVEGFMPNTEVSVYIFSTPTFLGKALTDSKGNYTTAFPSPDGLSLGMHTIQLVGYISDGTLTTISLPVLVRNASKTKVIKVYFPLGEARITVAEAKDLDRQLTVLKKMKITDISIKGFVQKTLKQVNDLQLPKMRAKKVAEHIKQFGIKVKPTLSSGGYASERNELARRVEITIKIAGSSNIGTGA
ncbi:Listeria/Bacterioides repeat [Candidatus Nanopelagicaceae bacterium]